MKSRTVLLGQIGKLEIFVEREYELFWWKPWFNGHVMREPFWRDYCNYFWHVSVGWFRYSAEIHWQVKRWGWNQTRADNPDPYIWFSIKDT